MNRWDVSERPGEPKDHRGEGIRFGQLLALLGATGFAISQPLLSIAGENPVVFTYAGVRGSGIVVFALLVALVPPLALWALTVAVGSVNRRAGDITFVGAVSVLVAATAIQWVKSTGMERGWLLVLIGLVTASGFAYLLSNIKVVAAWTRLMSPLPVVAVVLLLLSPTGQLLKSPTAKAAGSARAAAPSVVVIMLDEFPLKSMLAPDGSIDEVRFPNLAGLAEESTWYPNYTIMADRTVRSVPSILTGTNPTSDPPLWTSHPNSLFSLLAPTHELMVSEVMTQICGYASCSTDGQSGHDNRPGMKRVLSQMSDVWRQRVSLGPVDPIDFGQFRDDGDLTAAEEKTDFGQDDHHASTEEQTVTRPGPVNSMIGAIDPGDQPTLHYLHVILPHQPWIFYPDGQPFSGMESGHIYMPKDADPDPWIMAELQQGHLFQAQYADSLVGEVIEQLQASGRFDDSLVVVTADHGISFSSSQAYPEMRTFDEGPIADLAYVPLIIKEPNQKEGAIDEANIMAVDLLPTLADVLGLDIGWDVDGYPVGSPEIDERGDTKIYFEHGAKSAELEDGETFESADHRPEASDRLVGPLRAGDNPVAGLIARIGAVDHLDRPVTELEIDGAFSGTAQVSQLDRFEKPPEVVIARMLGTVDDIGLGRTVLVAFNGTVVSAAPVDDDGAFQTMLPPGIQKADSNEVRLYQVADDGTIGELDLG